MKESEVKQFVNEGELMDKVIDVVCDVCDVTREGILSSKAMPYPTCRGLCWYAMRLITGVTYKRIANVLHTKGSNFTTQSVCGTTTKAMAIVSKQLYWKTQWEEIRKRLDIKKVDKKDEPIVITVCVPKEAKGKVELKVIHKH